MAAKFIFVTGGVVSGLGKGITAASLGRLLKDRGLKIKVMKLDPYLNVDPGTMNPIQHGEVFVTDDGAETDLDLGHYERFIDESLSKNSSVTSGSVYFNVLSNERKGVYGGNTVQIIPHITNEIKRRIALNDTPDTDIVIVETGGTVGDIESLPFLEAIRQFSQDRPGDCVHIHVTLVPYIECSGELKTKPTQHSVKELLSLGIRPDIIVLRAAHPIDEDIKNKIALFCSVPKESVVANLNYPSLYEIPKHLEDEGLDKVVIKLLNLKCDEPDHTEWFEMLKKVASLNKTVKISLVGKYIELQDSYLSVNEALKHGGIANGANVEIDWIDSENITAENVKELLGGADGILVPGGFGTRGIEGKIIAANYARTNGVPYLGICLGLQIAVIEYARNVLGLKDANTTETDPDTSAPVIYLMHDQSNVTNLGGTMRLGAYPCVLDPDSKAYETYNAQNISERHRHRYEVNNDYRDKLEQHGMKICGVSPDKHIVEMVEVSDHPWYIATQGHPEFKSRPTRPAPLFKGLIEAAVKYSESK
ncbi:MAG: CTP synthase [Candidatus Fimenecus sp.]